jgi:uncharacterized membrane protein YbhN (UPF0104 family)
MERAPWFGKLTKTRLEKKEKSIYRSAKIILPFVFGGVCLYYILTAFEWTAIWNTLQTVKFGLFLTSSIFATLVFWLLRALRWKILLKDETLEISFLRLYLYTAITVGFANFTPFQSGEAFKIEIFKNYGGDRFSGYNYFFLEKILDLAVVAALSFAGIFVLFEFGAGNRLPLAIAGLIAAMLMITPVIVLILKKRAESRGGNALKLKNLGAAFFLTLGAWAAMIFGWSLIFRSAAIELTFLQTSAVISLTTVIGILSFIPGAVGVSEISIAALLSQLGYEKIAAQTGAVMIAVYSLMILILTVAHLIALKIINIKTANRTVT